MLFIGLKKKKKKIIIIRENQSEINVDLKKKSNEETWKLYSYKTRDLNE